MIKKYEIYLPDWVETVLRAVAKYKKADAISTEKLLSRVLLREMYEIVSMAIEMGLPLEEIQEGVLEVLVADMDELLWKIGIEDRDVTAMCVSSLLAIAHKHTKKVKEANEEKAKEE